MEAESEPIQVNSVAEEYQHIAQMRCGRCGGAYVPVQQSLLNPPDGPPLDRIEIVCQRCGNEERVSFDISTFFGK